MQKDILMEDNLQVKKPKDDNARGDTEKRSQEDQEREKVTKENEDLNDQKISEYGQTVLEKGKKEHKIHLLSIIGEIEGHECLPQHNKTTKYEHVLPQLAAIEDSSDIDGLLILINTVGGDVEAGLAIAEMIASLSKPTVSLVLGGSHSIGVPLAVSANYSYIVPTATMIIHPVRMNGTVIGVTQTFEYFEKIQDRIIKFVVTHSNIDYGSFKDLMLDTNQLAKDVGSILVGEETVKKGIINEVGGIKEALAKINEMIDCNANEYNNNYNNNNINKNINSTNNNTSNSTSKKTGNNTSYIANKNAGKNINNSRNNNNNNDYDSNNTSNSNSNSKN